ncbi:non-ribosomal peptide synthase/polyketide synthase [Flavobacterium cupriresistens]|nr:non-ribosomal peptide synthase/polyketide synthase [Flavobacterium sp. F-323]UFH41822.1 non-ribosomal peptide synthase/polyketide synthase [Flavobacterium sp. F-323]
MQAEILSILKEAHNKKIKIGIDKGSLTIKSVNPIDPDLLQKIKENKEAIIKYFEKRQSKKQRNVLEKIVAYDRNSITQIPLSFGQERLWFLDKLQGSAEYHMPVILRLNGDLDFSSLESSFYKIINRHEVLRTNIRSENGVGYQEVMSPENWKLEHKVVNENYNLEEIIASFIKLPFDLSNDYKLRSCLYDLGNQQYVLACVFHHIASDGWSEGILINEFTQLYSALKSGRTAVLPELPLQYSDYAVWQRKYLAGAVLESQLAYWEAKLKGAATLSLPIDYARPSVQSTAGSSVSLVLNKELSESLKLLCQTEGVTLFMLMLSVFKVLLSRYSGQEDICIGTPIANRTQSELEGMIGFFVNTLVLRNDLGGNPSFKDLLERVRETTLDSYDHQLVPFEKVVDRVVTTRDRSMTPLFQVMFILQNTAEESAEEGNGNGLEGITFSGYDLETINAKVDLTLSVSENNNDIDLDINYCTALFDKVTIDRMLLHYQELLTGIVSDINQPINTLSILTKGEEHQLLDIFNNVTVAYPKDKTIVTLFEEQVKNTPDAIAVVYEGAKLSYKELNEKSNQLGSYLREQGVEPDTLVGICVERGLEMLVGILGILKSGGAYVPIDPDYPEDRIAYMVGDAGINLVLSSATSHKVLEEYTNLNVVLLDTDWNKISNYSTENLSVVVAPDHLAYVIYTSGSTGNPKGVLITHSNVVRLFKNESCLFDFGTHDVWTLFHSFCFDFSVWEMYGALLHGGRLVVVPKAVTKDAISFKELLISEGVTVLNQTPGSFYALQEAFLSENFDHAIRYVIFGGEALNPVYLQNWKALYPSCKMINMYGITETTVHVTYKELTSSDMLSSVSAIGSAIPTLGCYILDANLNLVPVGVIGELCVGGAGVARGYLNREELTQEKFITNPFVAGDRLYRSGDLGRWLADGSIEYIGRKDNQVKIRGYRIELGEIENALSLLETVTQCCVLAKEDTAGNKRLVGYVVLEGSLNKEVLQEQLKLSLPEYMVPMIWVELDQMPLTSNGKLDKKALPDPDSSELSSKEYVAPRTDTERQLVEIWQNLLGIEKVGIYDNFFEIGGDSIISIRLISKINETFKQRIQLRDLFKYSTIERFSISVLNDDSYDDKTEQLYQRIDAELVTLGQSVRSSVANSDLIEDIYPMSDVQQGMIMESLVDPSLGVFHDQMVFPFIDGSFDPINFHKAVALLIEKHSIFRTSFNFSDYEQPVQIVYKDISFDIEEIDLTLFNKQEQERKIEEFLVSERTVPFTIQEGSLYRFTIFTIDAQTKLFVYQFHHAIMDGWSVASFVTELYKTYFELKKGNDSIATTAMACSQRDFIIKELMAKQDVDAISFWKEELSGYKYLDIFSEETEITEYYTAQYDLSFLNDLKQQCKEHNLTLKSVLFGAYIYALQLFTHETELTVGLVANNRPSIKDGDKVLGCFLNTVPVRYIFESGGSWLSYFKNVEKKMNEINLYGHLTFFEIKRLTGLNREDSFFDVLFNYIDFHVYNDVILENSSTAVLPHNDDADSMEELKTSSFERTSSSLNLTVNLTGGTEIEFQYVLHKNLKSGVSLERFHIYLDSILNCFKDQLQTNVNKHLILPKEESYQLLDVFNTTAVEYPKDKTIVALFEEQVKNTPAAIAVIYKGEELSYKELNKRSNALANYLLSTNSINSQSLIGVVLERSDWLIVSFLAILKTGAAYVPIDVNYPEERKEYIKNDSGCSIIIDNSFLSLFKETISDYSDVQPEIAIKSDDLAYVIYTSGSTGQPKGVMIEHKSITNTILSQIKAFSIGNSDSCLQFASPSFDASIWEICISLLSGSRLCIIEEEVKSNIEFFRSFIDNNSITFTTLPPAFLQLLSVEDLKGIRTLVTAGESIPLELAKTFSKHYNYINAYGPTEASICSTTFRGDINNLVSIGKPIDNTTAYIVDESNRLLPIGVVGELCVGGAGVARGYLNQEELTKEKFIVSPFVEGDRMYKTGDLARWLPDGNIEYVGRKDDQVKIRGYRIELGEIENALLSLEAVSQCCVLAKENAGGTKRLVGYVVLEGELDKVDLQEQLKLSLPEYMVPMIWVELDYMPLTSNGKLDKKALPDPDNSDLSTQEYVAPRTDTEKQLSIIWQQLLGIEKVGIYDNFFELGGHSLLATRLVSMIRKELSIEVSIREVFEYTSIAALGTHVSVQSKGVLLPTIVSEHRPERIPMSFSQERLWFLDQLQGSTEYHIPTVLRLEGVVDVSILEKTLHSIVSRHEVLRTILLSEDGVGYQQVIPAEDWTLDQVKIEDKTLLESSLQDYLMSPFDLAKDYKLRSCLYDLGNQQYVLACVFHHIASDGWSGGILINEFMELYSALQSGRTAVLPELTLQYSDYAIWQRKYLEGAVLDAQLAYWEAKLQGVATLSLPTDYPRPAVQSMAGSSAFLFLDKEISESLKALCQREGVTMFMVMLAAFKVLLSRYSGQDDICVGTPIENRTQSELEGMIGFFVNTLALRSDLGGNPDFKELLSRVKETTLDSYDHQLAPFEKVVDRVVTTRDRSMTPLFQVMFDFHNSVENAKEGTSRIEDLVISGHEYSDTTAQFDLMLSITENDFDISVGINYCTALFDQTTIDRMLLHYKELLVNVLSDISQPIHSLPMLTAAESHQIAAVFNDTFVEYPLDQTVVDLFEQQVQKTPDAIAVVFGSEELSYKELDKRSNQLAHYLRDQGVVADSLVGICVDRSLNMLVGILGILKSGGAYVPVKPDYPASRISYIAQDTGCSLVLTDESSKEALSAILSDSKIIVLDDSSSVYANCSVESLGISYSPASLSYVIYTSGSTGAPKGAMIEHSGLLNHLLIMIDDLNMDSTSVVAFTAPFTFDISVWQLLSGLLCGGRIAIYSESMILDTNDFQNALCSYGVTHLQLVPSYILNLLETGSRKGLEDLRYFLVTGEAATISLLESWFASFPSIAVVNAYGPAEASDDVSLHIMYEAPSGVVVPIGKPVANMQLYVVDAYDNLCPIGVVGELWVSGVGVGRGYLNREELTQEKFIANPFAGGDRIYKTGDLVRWLADGSLEFIGRKDNQVKIRGYRIELGEIENALSSLSGIIQCGVLAKEDASGNKRLVGYVVVEGKLDKADVQEQLKSSLPEYMVPMIWVELDELPLTPNGKLDRKALPDPDNSDLSTQEYVAPRTETEEQLAVIWQNLLGIEKVGIYDNFFELGGHSLLATRLVSMIRKELSIEVSIREIFEYTTIATLGAYISVQSTGVLLPTIVVEERPARIPLSFSQERLWFLDQLEGSVAYHIPIVLRLEGAVDVSILGQTLQSIVSRHEVLRTVLLSEDGVGYQEIIGAENWKLDQIKIEDTALLESSLQDYLMLPFDLAKEYKLRSCLYDLGNQQYVLACVFHHIASDDWSEGILVNEFMEFYSALQSGRTAVLPELTLQYSDYAIWQRKYLEGAVLEAQLSYWEEKLQGLPTLSLPTDYARPSVQSTAGSRASLILDKELSESLNALCQREGVTLFMVMLSAFKVLLSRYSGQDDICVGTSIANRTQAELEGMIGFFVNVLALRSDLGGNPSFKELLERVKETTLGGYDHQLVPFEKIVDRMIINRDRSMSPLFQVLFVLHNAPEESGETGKGLENVTLSGYEFDAVTSKSDLTLNVSEEDSMILLTIEFCTALFDKATIDRMLLHYKELLGSIVKDMNQPIESLSMLDQEDKQQLLTVFNDTAFAYPQDKTIVDLFNDQVLKTPQAIALVFEDQVMTYKELDERSNQLVHYFESMGVISDSRIGILFNRSFDMIVSILGILKSGCTYIPLDPTLPSKRLSHIVEDSSVNFLLYREDSLLSSLSVSDFIFFLDIAESSAYESSKVVNERHPASVAYVMYTSGTTGNPKGVMITDDNIVSLCKSCDYISLNSDTVWLSTGSISFDATTIEFFGTLLNGGQLILADTNTLLSVVNLKELIIKHKVTTMWMTASWFHQVVEDDVAVFENLIDLVVGGDVVLFNYTNKLKELYPQLHIVNGYGPTENTTFSTTYSIDEVTHRNIPIGKPIRNSQAYILDSKLNLLPIGVIGELCVGGSGLAKGYLNQEELTQEKFIANPFIEGDRIYKTGDLARWLPDGNIEYVGRKDDQIKIRGYRIELGEIETALSSVSGIIQCCVLAREDEGGNKRLIGYVVSEGKLNTTDLQERLRVSLPEYMVPMFWVELDQLPLTSNGKLDKKALPDPDSSELSGKEFVAPGTDTEKQLAIIWQQLLGIEKIGIHDNFFELGGHSLLATRLVSMIRKELTIEIEIVDVFEHTTIAALGAHVSVQSKGVLLPTIVSEHRPERIPLSFSQERLWFLDQLQGSTEYHIPTVLRLEGVVDVSILEKTLHNIVSRHEVLRTILLSEDGVGYQQVIAAEDWTLDQVKIEDKTLLESSLQDYLMSPFDLAKDYKLRSCLYDLGNQQYVLACVLHHIVSDGWSGGILISEFMELYSALQSGRTAVLPELTLQYSDYAIWQRKYLEGAVLDAQLAYWEAKLQGVATLSLPTDYPRPAVQSMAGSSAFLFLDKEISESLRALCQREGVTMFMVMLAAFKVLLSRYSGQDDICVGTPIANRTQSELEGMIGFFVNTLVLRSDLGGNPDFKELLSRVKETTLGSYDHQLAPFEKVVDRVVTTRDRSMTPLFQVMFDFHNEIENSKEESPSLENLIISEHEYSDATSLFDLMLSITENDFDISVGINYCTALFDQTTIDRMLLHYKELLVNMLNDISQPIHSLPMLTAAESHQIAAVFNDTFVDYPLDQTVVDLFEQQVQKTPDAIAVVFGSEELSYKELDKRSNQLGHYLRDQGVVADSLVGICVDRSLNMLVGILGILKSGGAYVPVKPDYPASRISYIAQDTGCSLVLTDESSKEALSAILSDSKIIVLDDSSSVYANCSVEPLGISYSPASLSYVIYTSGSTGAPKGAMIEHSGLLNHLLIMIDDLNMDSTSVVAFTAPFTFDISVWQLLSGLLCGGRIAIYSESMILDTNDFQNALCSYGVTHLQLVPSYILNLLETGSRKGLEDLRYFLVTGEAATISLLESWFASFPSIAVVNAYGPAEASDDVSLHIMYEAPSGVVVPIGKPVANMQLYVVDAYDNLCPIGVVGELWVSGVGVGRGYLNREELTQEKFIANPFAGGDRIYKTGDLVRWLADGSLEFIGRKDNQVKIRGYRIELGEIENALSSLSGIIQCGVLAKEDASGNKRLVGYVVVEGKLDKADVQEQLKSSLPEYMVPMIWVELDQLPLTPNGKLDRKALPDPDNSDLSTQEYVAPRTETEEQLAVIWQNLLGIEKVGIYDNFFELGGHSLLATRLVSMIRKELSIEVSIREVFEYTSIAALGAHVSVQSTGVLLPTIVVEERPARIPLSFSQERLWFLDQLQGSTEYHIPIVFRLEGAVDVSILGQTLQSIVSRHEVLRTILLSEDGVGYQAIIPAENWKLDQIKIEDTALLESSLQDYLILPFDLAKEYKLRSCLYDLGNQQYVLACVFHHIASDAWSEGILVNEFMEFYSALQSGRTAVLPELTLQYSDYAIWQRKYLEGVVLEAQLSYWEEKLQGLPTLSLPTDYTRPSVQSTAGLRASLVLDNELNESLNALCQREGVTLFMVMLSAFKVLLSRYSGQDDICVGTSIANRTQAELEGMIGFFVNVLALRSDLGGNPSFKELLERVKETTLGGYDHQSVPFEKVVDRVVTTRDRSMTPLFQVAFVLQNTPQGSEESEEGNGLEGITLSDYEFDTVTSQFDLTLNVSEESNGTALDVMYCTALFDKTTIDRMLLHYRELLVSIVNDVNQPIESLSMLDQEDKQQLLTVFNDTAFAYPQDKTIVDLFNDQVLKTPQAIALVFEDQVMTYKELDERSNQLVHYFESMGVISDSRIGILFNRSFDMIVSILGILKSGCTYVPLDPTLPSKRLSYIVEDSSVNFLLYREDSLLSSLSVSDFIFFLDIAESSAYESSKAVNERHSASVAYVMYTSGTTGVPKGISISDENVITLINDPSSAIAINCSDRVLQWSNYAFDGSTYEIFGSLLNGASLYLIDKSVASDAGALSKVINRNELSVIFITTALFNSLAEYDLSLLSSLRLLLFGGEKVSITPVRKMLSGLGSGKIHHVYGPTETTVYATCYAVFEISDSATTIPIGKPLTNTNLYVLNPSLDLVPIGVIGELCIGGSGVAGGYLNQEELTKENFIANPFVEGDRMYKTGDLVRWLADGNIEYIGRKDNQVKIRGYRIELGEIENVLSSFSEIIQCCVLVREDEVGNKRLIGYVVSEGKLNTTDLQERLRVSLPEYMVPMFWVEMDQLPLTSNGKLDKKALPDPDSSELSSKEFVAPGTDTEKQLAVIWQQLLGIEKIGIHDNFFELGGHSLLAIKLVAKINEVLDSNTNIMTIFEYPTISNFVENIDSMQSAKENILIPLQKKGSNKAIYLAPPGGGTVNCYIELVKLLGDDQPVYAFQSPGLNGKSPVSESIEEMASKFIEEMQKIDQYGPYRIGGYSLGGILAYEMAVQLQDKGFDVEELLILDSSFMGFDVDRSENKERDDSYRSSLKTLIQAMFGDEFNWSDLVLENKTAEEQIEAVSKVLSDSKLKINEDEVRGHLEVIFRNENYIYIAKNKPKLKVPIILFRAMYTEIESEIENKIITVENDLEEFDYGWQEYTTEQVIVHNIPSTHITLLDNTYIKEISDILISLNELTSEIQQINN